MDDSVAAQNGVDNMTRPQNVISKDVTVVLCIETVVTLIYRKKVKTLIRKPCALTLS